MSSSPQIRICLVVLRNLITRQKVVVFSAPCLTAIYTDHHIRHCSEDAVQRMSYVETRGLRMQNVMLSKLLQSSYPRYLHDLITIQPSQSTRSSTLVILLQPSVDSSLKITNRSFQHAAPHLWNKLPPTLCVPYQSGASSSPSSTPSSGSDPRPLVDISGGLLHSCLKTLLF